MEEYNGNNVWGQVLTQVRLDAAYRWHRDHEVKEIWYWAWYKMLFLHRQKENRKTKIKV